MNFTLYPDITEVARQINFEVQQEGQLPPADPQFHLENPRLSVNNDMSGELDDSGLEAGEVVQMHGTKFRVLAGDEGLRIELIRKPVGEKKKAKRR